MVCQLPSQTLHVPFRVNATQRVHVVHKRAASRDRLRAILIGTGTTIAGLLPILLETSTQAAAIQPVVISVVFGLLTSTVLVLLVIPALYVLFDDWGLAGRTGITEDE